MAAKDLFHELVHRVLLHSDVSCIQCLRFHLFKGDDLYFKLWLGVIARHDIREIEISLEWPRHATLSKRLFSCKRLMVRKLEGKFAVSVPEPLLLPNLKIIHLVELHVPNDECMKRLSSGSCVFEKLHIEFCHGISSLYVLSSTLKTLLVISTMELVRGPLTCIVIKAPNLMHRTIEDMLMQYDICELSSLVEANLDVHNCNGALNGHGGIQHSFELVRKVSGVNTLWLGGSLFFRHLTKPSIVQNLTRLKVDVVEENAHRILECAPKLKFLTLDEVSMDDCEISIWDYLLESKSELSYLSCLEKVELICFAGEDIEMRLVAYLLKASPVLKEMKIIMDPCVTEFERRVYEGLLMLPRSSTICQVIVIHETEAKRRENTVFF